MRHLKKSRRFGRRPSHRRAMFNNMVTSLFLHERILTTLERAKELRRVAEKLVTLGKRGDLAARRLAARRIMTQGHREGKRRFHKNEALNKLFEIIGPRYQDRPGGYTRIIRTGRRLGDNASMAFIEMLPEERKPQTAKKKSGQKSTPKASKGKAAAASGKRESAQKSGAVSSKASSDKTTAKSKKQATTAKRKPAKKKSDIKE